MKRTSDGVVAVIPARGGSKRLPRKNIHPVLGAPMLAWVLQACRQSRYVGAVCVSTEDGEIAEVARHYGADIVDRPRELATDDVFKQDVVIHAVDELASRGVGIEIVVAAQPNSPELQGVQIDAAIEKLREFSLYEVFSVDERLIQNAAFRIMREPVVRQRALSVYCGVVVADLVDVHTAADVAAVEARLRASGAQVPRPWR